MSLEIHGSLCGNEISFAFDGLRVIYACVAVFMWAMCTLISPEYFRSYKNNRRYYVFFALTLPALIGVFLSGDLFTTFIFFEIMSLTSYVWVAQDERERSLRAAATYLGVAVIGGLVMLMGLFMLYDLAGTLNVSKLPDAVNSLASSGMYTEAALTKKLRIIGALIFTGFAAKAGVYPLHIWLPKAHPVAPAPASALLSGILTKSGIYGVLIVTLYIMQGDLGWAKAMLFLGLITMFLGAVLALFSVDLKRTLACSSMSQIGFIMTGIGMGAMLGAHGVVALRGTFLHMLNHSMIKLVLFLSAGVIYFNLHKLNINDIRGFGRNKNFLKIVFLIGACSIAGIPMFSGYVSKTLLHEGILEGTGILGTGTAGFAEWVFLFSGGCTLAYMIKLFVAIFVEKNEDENVQKEYDEMKKLNAHTQRGYIGLFSRLSLLISAAVLFVPGILPYATMDKAATAASSFLRIDQTSIHHVNYFSLENLKGSLISITIGIVLYFVFVRGVLMKKGKYVDRWPEKLDLENLIYRPVLLIILPSIGTFFSRICDDLVDGTIVLLRKTLFTDKPIPREYTEGNGLTHAIGDGMDDIHRALAGEDRDPLRSYEHRLAMWYMRFSENRTIISRSLSFGLALASVGLLFTIGYVIFYLL
ncbi:MAG: sodium:proton antiporter [Lachnospiraceae bacterium]|nr:sodium:proton antiporter [Lachnospiraceae bacterium]